MKPKMAYFQVYPGFDPGVIKFAVDNGTKAIIIQGYHSGTACVEGEYDITPSLEYAKEKNIPVFLIFGFSPFDEDCAVGYSHFEKGKKGGYLSSQKMVEAGIVPLRANWQNDLDVVKSLQEILAETEERGELVRRMTEKYAFDS